MEDLFNNTEQQEPVDYTELIKGYPSKWIVISEDNSKVIASGDSPADIINYKDQGIVMKVPDFNKFLALALK